MRVQRFPLLCSIHVHRVRGQMKADVRSYGYTIIGLVAWRRGLRLCPKDAKEEHEAHKKVTPAKQGNIWNQSLKSLELLCESISFMTDMERHVLSII